MLRSSGAALCILMASSLCRPFRLWGWSILAVLACSSVVGCKKSPELSEPVSAEEAVPVTVEFPSRQEVIESVRGESTLRPLAQVRVLAENLGRVESLDSEVGDLVVKGQRLARLANDDLALQIAQANDNLAVQQKEYDAARPLYEEGFLARQNFEQLELTVAQAQNALARLRTQSKDQQIRAPMTGVVLTREIELGQQVSAGTQLFQIADLSELRIRIPIPERSLRFVRVAQPAIVELSALDSSEVAAVVDRILPAVDPASGTVEVELRLLSTALDDGTPLLPGMYARVRIETQRRPNVLVVPRQAVVDEGGERSLFIVEAADDAPSDGGSAQLRVSQRPITIGWEGDGLVEIIDGLADDERFVRIGQNRLRQGNLVRIVGATP